MEREQIINSITEDAKRLHIGDLYYDTTSGFSYEWMFSGCE